jgi:hypothetical protein
VDIFPLGYVTTGGGWALVALFVTLVLRGKLMPRSFYDDKVREGEADRKRADELAEQNGILLREFGPTLQKFLVDLRTAAREIREEREESADNAPEEQT